MPCRRALDKPSRRLQVVPLGLHGLYLSNPVESRLLIAELDASQANRGWVAVVVGPHGTPWRCLVSVCVFDEVCHVVGALIPTHGDDGLNTHGVGQIEKFKHPKPSHEVEVTCHVLSARTQPWGSSPVLPQNSLRIRPSHAQSRHSHLEQSANAV